MKATETLLQAIAVTAELTGTTMSPAAARVMAEDFARYPEAQILQALTKCRRELKGRLTIADVLTRLEDGRPGIEEAWAMMPKTEAQSVVWTTEMAAAFGIALRLLDEDPIAARMAFKEAYAAAVCKARDKGLPPKWTVSLGHDPRGREDVVIEAVKLGRLGADHAHILLPHIEMPAENLKALGYEAKDEKVAL